MQNQTWTQTHTFFDNGAAKVHRLADLNVAVVGATYVAPGTKGWAFQYEGVVTETHTGFRTMKAAKAAAIAYATSPISEAHAAADAHRG